RRVFIDSYFGEAERYAEINLDRDWQMSYTSSRRMGLTPVLKTTRSTTKTDSTSSLSSNNEEEIIQKVVEKVLTSEVFMEKLISGITARLTDTLSEQVQSHVVKLKDRITTLENKIDRLDQSSRERNILVYGIPKNLSLGNE
ncbi:hypothetical protein HHI36_012454, partial [Cryptolaemus montrouzieri]